MEVQLAADLRLTVLIGDHLRLGGSVLLLVVEHVGRQLVLPATLALFICERVAGLVDGTRRSTAGCLVSAGS